MGRGRLIQRCNFCSGERLQRVGEDVYVCQSCSVLCLDPVRFLPLRKSTFVHPVLQGCRGCGCERYARVAKSLLGLSEVYSCVSCSVLFLDPVRFVVRPEIVSHGSPPPRLPD